MNLGSGDDSGARFRVYVEGLAGATGRVDRHGPLRDYCTGLMLPGLTLPGQRKSVEPMAARTAPARTAAQHQSLLHFVGVATWSDEPVLGKVRDARAAYHNLYRIGWTTGGGNAGRCVGAGRPRQTHPRSQQGRLRGIWRHVPCPPRRGLRSPRNV